jgi:GNAT superfamily N-acetyltransferase
MPHVAIRGLRQTDEQSFLKMQMDTFKGLEYLPRIRAGLSALDREGSFLAETAGSIIGCIGLYALDRPNWFEIRNLALKDSEGRDVGKRLIEKTLAYVGSKDGEYVKASTPAVQPYVDLFKKSGFEPARRSLRIAWDIATCQPHESRIETRELSEESAEDASEVWLKGLRPFWDYWIEEQGGPLPLKAWVKESVSKRQGWTGAFLDDRLVGLAILRPDYYGPGEARFNGAYAIPEFRKRGVGSALMNAVFRDTRKRNQRSMRVYTLGYLDHLAPGAVLYLKTGGRIEGEYLQLQKKRN